MSIHFRKTNPNKRSSVGNNVLQIRRRLPEAAGHRQPVLLTWTADTSRDAVDAARAQLRDRRRILTIEIFDDLTVSSLLTSLARHDELKNFPCVVLGYFGTMLVVARPGEKKIVSDLGAVAAALA